MISNKRVLIVGYGSIGRKHLLACRNLNIEPRVLSNSRVDEEGFEPFWIDAAELGETLWDLIIIANNTQEHVAALLEFSNYGSKLLIEKPLATSKKYVDRLADLDCDVFVGYNLRYLDFSRFLRDLFRSSEELPVYISNCFVDSASRWYGSRVKENYVLDAFKGGGSFWTNYHELDFIKFVTSREFESLRVDRKYSPQYSGDTTSIVEGRLQGGITFSCYLSLISNFRKRTGMAIFNSQYFEWDVDEGIIWVNGKEVFRQKTDYSKTYISQLEHVLVSGDIASRIKTNINDLKILKDEHSDYWN